MGIIEMYLTFFQMCRMFLLLLMLYSISALPVTLLICFIGRKRTVWLKREFLFIPIPFLVWLFLMVSNFISPNTKTLSNLSEVFFCGIAGGFILLPRLLLPATSNKSKVIITSISTLVIGTIVFLIYFFMPSLPE